MAVRFLLVTLFSLCKNGSGDNNSLISTLHDSNDCAEFTDIRHEFRFSYFQHL